MLRLKSTFCIGLLFLLQAATVQAQFMPFRAGDANQSGIYYHNIWPDTTIRAGTVERYQVDLDKDGDDDVWILWDGGIGQGFWRNYASLGFNFNPDVDFALDAQSGETVPLAMGDTVNVGQLWGQTFRSLLDYTIDEMDTNLFYSRANTLWQFVPSGYLGMRLDSANGVYAWLEIAVDTSTSFWSLTFKSYAVWPATAVHASQAAELEGIRLFPNPSSEYFFLEFPSHSIRPVSVELWGVEGQKVREWPGRQYSKGFRFDVSDLSPGHYFVRVKTDQAWGSFKLRLLR